MSDKAIEHYASVIHRHRAASAESYSRFATFARVYLLPHLPAERDARILDLGCGSGNLLWALRDAGYSSVLGVDASAEQVAEALRFGLDARIGDATAFLRESTGRFDAITLIDVVEHIDPDDLSELLTLAASRLRDGGVLLAHTTNGWSPYSRYFYSGDVTHRCLYSPKSLADVATLSGLTDARAQPAVPEHDWKRRSSPPRWIFDAARTVAWWVISRAYAMREFIAIGAWHGVYTPNFVFVARKPAGPFNRV